MLLANSDLVSSYVDSLVQTVSYLALFAVSHCHEFETYLLSLREKAPQGVFLPSTEFESDQAVNKNQRIALRIQRFLNASHSRVAVYLQNHG